MDTHRTERISEALREELGELIGYELTDPRIGDAVVTEVLVSPDKKHAQVRLHLSAEPGKQEEAILALDGAKGFLKRALSARLTLFRIPELHFEADTSFSSSGRMNDLMKRIKRGRPKEEARSADE
jgi:ribosome-binding factor A